MTEIIDREYYDGCIEELRKALEEIEAVAIGKIPEIAAAVGRPLHAVTGRVYRMGLKSGRPPTRTDYSSIRRNGERK